MLLDLLVLCVWKRWHLIRKQKKRDQSMELRYDIFMYYSVHVFPLITYQSTFNIFFAQICFIIKTAKARCVMTFLCITVFMSFPSWQTSGHLIYFFLHTFVSLLNQLETDCVMSAFKKGKLKYKITDYDIFMYCSVQFFLLITDQRTLNIDLCINLSFPS